jgi:hypothetical protein
MMLNELLEMYRDGAITGYQIMIDCLHRLDPEEPEVILGHLPDEVLDEMLAYARRYEASRMRSISGPPPTEEQVSAARKWIEQRNQHVPKRNLAS